MKDGPNLLNEFSVRRKLQNTGNTYNIECVKRFTELQNRCNKLILLIDYEQNLIVLQKLLDTQTEQTKFENFFLVLRAIISKTENQKSAPISVFLGGERESKKITFTFLCSRTWSSIQF